MKKVIIFFVFIYSIKSVAQYTAIPDVNFEQALVDLGIDSDNTINAQVLCADINTIEILNLYNKNISDLTGIQGFISLKHLDCSNNYIENLNVSNLTELISLDCSYNEIENINLQGCPSLILLECRENLITTLDFSSNGLLEELNCGGNQIHSIPTQQLPHLKYLDFYHNWVNAIDLSFCPELEYFRSSSYTSGEVQYHNIMETLDFTNNHNIEWIECNDNSIDHLVLGNHPQLSYLAAGGNQISTINLSNCPSIVFLYLPFNQLTTLDLTNLPYLKKLYVFYNNLTNIDVSNNTLLEFLMIGEVPVNGLYETNQLVSLNVSNNPNLRTIYAPFAFYNYESNPDIHLDFSNTPQLNYLDLGINKIKTLNIANGNNENLTLKIGGTTTLQCVKVDNQEIADIANADLNSWQENDITFYNIDCPTASIEAFESAVKFFPNPVDNFFNIQLENSELDFFEIFEISGKKIYSNNLSDNNLSKLKSGLYYIKIYDKQQHIYLREFIKK